MSDMGCAFISTVHVALHVGTCRSNEIESVDWNTN